MFRDSAGVLVGSSRSGGNNNTTNTTTTTVSGLDLKFVSDSGNVSGRARVLGSHFLMRRAVGGLGLCTRCGRNNVLMSALVCTGRRMGISVSAADLGRLGTPVGLAVAHRKNVCRMGNGCFGPVSTRAFRGTPCRVGGALTGLPTRVEAGTNALALARGPICRLGRNARLGIRVVSPFGTSGRCFGHLAVGRAGGATGAIRLAFGSRDERENISFLGNLVSTCGCRTGVSGGRVRGHARSFVGDQLTGVSARLANGSAGLRGCGRGGHVISVKLGTGRTMLDSSRFSRRLGGTGVRIRLLGRVNGCVSRPTGGCRPVPAGMNLRSRDTATLVKRCGDLTLAHGRLLRDTDRSSPIMAPVATRLRSLVATVGQTVFRTEVGVGVRHGDVTSVTDGCRGAVNIAPRRRGTLARVKHRRSIASNLCLVLLRGHRRASVSLTSATSGTGVVRPTTFMSGMDPGKVVTLLVTFVLNITVPTNVVCLHRLLHGGVLNRSSMRGLARLPVVKSVPATDTGKDGNGVIVRRGGDGLVSRVFEKLHAGLRLTNSSGRGMFVIASAAAKRNGAFVTSGLTVDLTLLRGGAVVIKLSVEGPEVTRLFNVNSHRRNVAGVLTGRRYG